MPKEILVRSVDRAVCREGSAIVFEKRPGFYWIAAVVLFAARFFLSLLDSASFVEPAYRLFLHGLGLFMAAAGALFAALGAGVQFFASLRRIAAIDADSRTISFAGKARGFSDVRGFSIVAFGRNFQMLAAEFHDQSTRPLVTLSNGRKTELESLRSELQKMLAGAGERRGQPIASTFSARFELAALWILGFVFLLLGLFPWRALSLVYGRGDAVVAYPLWSMGAIILVIAAFRTVTFALRKSAAADANHPSSPETKK